MTWLEQLNTLQSKLVDASPIDVSNELFDAVNLFQDAYSEVAQRATESLHISPYWAEAGRLIPPFNSEMVVYLAVRDIAYIEAAGLLTNHEGEQRFVAPLQEEE